MPNSYIDFMCTSLIQTLCDNKSLNFEEKTTIVLVNKNGSKHILNCNKDNIKTIIGRLLQFKSTSILLSSIDIECNGKLITSIEIV